MTNSPSFPARLVASVAIVAGVIALIVVISSSTGGDSSPSAHRSAQHRRHHAAKQAQRHVPATYTVQSGDTLTDIAHSVGIPVTRIERLNPEVDPQILIAGETLKLK